MRMLFLYSKASINKTIVFTERMTRVKQKKQYCMDYQMDKSLEQQKNQENVLKSCVCVPKALLSLRLLNILSLSCLCK